MAARYDAFWSFAITEKADYDIEVICSALHEGYRVRSQNKGRACDAFYICLDRKNSHDWRQQLLEACDAPVLIPVITDGYFASAYCFFEWLAFHHRWAAREQFAGSAYRRTIGVWLPLSFVESDPRTYRTDAESVLAEIRSTFGPAGSPADQELWHSAFAKSLSWEADEGYLREQVLEWPTALARRDVRWVTNPTTFATSGVGSQVVDAILDSRAIYESLRSGLVQFDHSLRAPLQKAAQLALFCLAFDRFHEGGWGFSLEEDYGLFGDGDVVATGTDEVNFLVVRALRQRLDRARYGKELDLLIARPGIRPNLDVTDGQQRLTNCMLRLISQLEVAIGRHATDIVKAAIEQNPRRWILPEKEAPHDTAVLHYVFGQKLLTAIEDRGIGTTLGLEYAPDDEADLAATKFREHLRQDQRKRRAALANALRETGLSTVFPRRSERGQLPRGTKMRSLLQLYFLLSDGEFVAQNIGACLSDARTFDLKSALREPLSELALLCLALDGLIWHGSKIERADNDDDLRHDLERVQAHFAKLWTSLQVRLTASLLPQVAKMNCVGWSAFLLLCERRGVTPVTLSQPTKDATPRAWNSGLVSRTDIGNEVGKCPSGAIGSSLVDLVARRVSESCGAHLEPPAAAAREDWTVFARRLLSTGILLPEHELGAPLIAAPTTAPYATYVGMLEVERVSREVRRTADRGAAAEVVLRARSADAGYGRLFLAPFSRRTGLRADNLARVIRHFGGGDDELVDNIARVVVKDCFVVRPDGLASVSFASRTKQIIEVLLTKADGVAEQDILELFVGHGDDVVYVRRNATLFTEQSEKHGQRRFFRWLFSDMTTEWQLANYSSRIVKARAKGAS